MAWVFLVILLGALGTGLWQYAIAPSLSFVTRIALNIATLGVEGYKNAIYLDIAKGYHETSSLAVLWLVTGGVTGVLLGMSIALYLAVRIRVKGVADREPRPVKTIYRLSFALLLSSIFLAIILFIMSVQLRYVNGAITHFQQLYSIVSPNIDEHDKELFRSRFAQIKNRDDYMGIISELKSIASDNDLFVPSFSIW